MRESMGRDWFLAASFGSWGAGAGGLESHHMMQKLLLAFYLVAHKTLFRTRDETVTAVFG
jgi:hypothetical protein